MSNYKKNTDLSYYMYHKKRKERRKRRITYALLLLLITIVMLSTSTYAWFTVNRIVYIDSMEVKVEASGGIEISVDAEEWQTTITTDNIKEASTTFNYKNAQNQIPETVFPVSTGGEIDNQTGYLKMYLGSATGTNQNKYILTSQRDIEQNNNIDGNFIAFDMFLKINNSQSQDTQLYLTNDSIIEYSGDKEPGIENATRIAFVIEGNTETNSNLSTIQSLKGATNDTTYIWEPNYDVHTNNGIKNAKNVYKINLNNKENNKVDYDGMINEIKTSDEVYLDTANATNHPNFFKNTKIDIITPSNPQNYTKAFSIKKGITKVRVYIWLEGQDVDCEDNSAIGNIKFTFQLTTNPN